MNDLNGYDIEDLRAGMHATYSKTITEADIVLFAAVSGDNNAVHTNEEYAATTSFKGRIRSRLPERQCDFRSRGEPASGTGVPGAAVEVPRAGASRGHCPCYGHRALHRRNQGSGGTFDGMSCRRQGRHRRRG